MRLRDRLAGTPLVGDKLLRSAFRFQSLVDRTPVRLLRQRRFRNSAGYWERRYAGGGTSGAGSSGEVAAYKAAFLNSFVATHDVASVIEFGCGDGEQLALARYPSYIGLDVSSTALRRCLERFAGDTSKTFLPYTSGAFADPLGRLRCDLALSLDVIFHLVEDDVYTQYLADLFASAGRYVIIFSPDGPLGDVWDAAPHVRGRRFTERITSDHPDWQLEYVEANPLKDAGALTTRSEFHVFGRDASS
jgi:hypothetical protein